MKKDQAAVEFVRYKIGLLAADTSGARAALAQLRRGIGHAPGELPELWGLCLDGLPEELLSVDGRPTCAEWAVYNALTLFALHQQSQSSSMHKDGRSLGQAVRELVKNDDDMERVKRRFDALATAESLEEMTHYLRGLIQMMRAEGVALDYGALCKDLFWVQQRIAAPSVKLRWGQDFYRRAAKAETVDAQSAD